MNPENKSEEELKEERNAYRKKLGKPVNPEVIGTEEDPQIPPNPSNDDEEEEIS